LDLKQLIIYIGQYINIGDIICSGQQQDYLKSYDQIEFINKEYIITPLELEEIEGPSMLEIKEYLERKMEIV